MSAPDRHPQAEGPRSGGDLPAVPDEVSIPALLRAARGAYGHSISHQLEAAGLDDLPSNGPFLLGAVANRGGTAEQVVEWLGISKQAASQLIDTLVVRGYLTREVNADDRRRMVIGVTERGQAAATAVRLGVEQVGAQLAALLTPTELSGLVAGLRALAELKMAGHEGSPDGSWRA